MFKKEHRENRREIKKQETQKEQTKQGKAAAVLTLFLSPAAAYVIFESITGNIGNISPTYTMLNLAAYYLIYLLLFAAAGCTRMVYPVLNTVFTFSALAEYFVMEFRGRPIMLGDILAVKTALTVSGSYSYTFTPKLLCAVLVSLMLSLMIIAFPFRLKNLKERTGIFLVMLAVTLGFGMWFYKKGIKEKQIDINMWDPAGSYKENGFILSTLYAFSDISVDPPESYSINAVNQIGKTAEEYRQNEYEDGRYLWKSEGTDIVPENIICIMNESFSDLGVIGDFDTDVPYLENYKSLSENCIKGNLYMPVFGAMTCNSEYEFLTGNAMSFAPPASVPYQMYVDQTVYGLPLTLKNQGYRTVAMHPYPAGNWNRNQAFPAMGFDEFLAEEAFEGAEKVRGYVSDKATYDKIISLTEEKTEGEPLFVFNVTMQNHGGYTDEGYESQVHLTEMSDMPKAEQYLSLVKESDEALGYLLDYYKNVDEPTMIVMFGDHQPGIEEEFYEAVYGKTSDEISEEETIRRYITPFFVWTNYDMPSQTVDKMSAAYLSNVVVERANLQPTDYQVFMDNMYGEAPVIHPLGYYNAEGIWSNWDNWKEKKEYSLFKDYYILNYNNMMGRKKRNDRIFCIVPDSN